MNRESETDEMLPEYDFSGGVRGKYAKRYHQESNVVVLDPDVAERFPNAEAVNGALRALAGLQRAQNGDTEPVEGVAGIQDRRGE